MPSPWRVRVAVCSVTILAVLSCASAFRSESALAASSPPPSVFQLVGSGPPRTPWDFPNQDVCGSVGAGQAQCLARVLDTVAGEATAQPAASTGLSPVNLEAVYGFSATSSSDGDTIALVDAYDDPNIAADLNSFDSEYGLAAASLTKVYIEANLNGQPVVEKSPPPENPGETPGWDLETSLDVEWAHAIDPEAKLLLVEAYSDSFANLLAAEQYAGSNATYVSNSWGGSEFSGEPGYDSDFEDPGVYYFAAAGDAGARWNTRHRLPMSFRWVGPAFCSTRRVWRQRRR